jgi:hypothetical protein
MHIDTALRQQLDRVLQPIKDMLKRLKPGTFVPLQAVRDTLFANHSLDQFNNVTEPKQ